MLKFIISKNLHQLINAIKFKKQLLNSLNPGDLVWSKMPLSKKELNKIEESHRIRPYLVMHKSRFNIYAYPSSSKQFVNLNNTKEYCIHKARYNKNKDSFINLSKIYRIPVIDLQQKYITLNELDLKNIQKRLLIQGEKIKYKFLKEIRILEGDVIKIDKQLYYVYASDNMYLYCLIIFKKCPQNKKHYAKIVINNKTYYTTFKEKATFERNMQMNIIDIAYKSEIAYIAQKKTGIEFQQKKLSNLEKKIIENNSELVYESGTVFQIGKSKVVYLFKYKNAHYGIDLLMYKIKPKMIPIFDIEKRQILKILSPDELLKIVDFLSSNNVQPLKEINMLYDDLRTIVYN